MRINKQFTVGAAPFNVFTGLTTAPGDAWPPKIATRISVQMKAGGSGLGYYMSGVPRGAAGDPTNTAHLTCQLAAATATAPGGQVQDVNPDTVAGIDVTLCWVHGAQAGDVMIVSFDLKC
jgi:hypothetical protein